MFGRKTNQPLVTVLLGVMLLIGSSAGCRSNSGWKFADSFDWHSPIPWKGKKHKTGVPARLVSTWTDAVRHTPGKKPERGFGGRILFYDAKSNEPIAVEGQLVVYAFDEEGRKPTDNRPTRRYVFPPEQFAKHVSDNELGVSYSVWLPWDEVGGERKKISLICRFESAEGPLLVGDQTTQFLSGTMLASDEEKIDPLVAEMKAQIHQAVLDQEKAKNDAQAVSYNAQTPGEAAIPMGSALPEPAGTSNTSELQRMTTTSISLPSRFRREGPTATVRSAGSTPMSPMTLQSGTSF